MTSATPAPAPMPSRRLAPPTPRVALVIGAAIVVGVILYMARNALAPFVIGALLVYLLDPAVGWVSRLRIAGRQMPRGLAVLVVYVISFVLVVEGLALLLGPLVRQLLDYVRDLPALLGSLEDLLAQLGQIYQSLELPQAVRDAIDEALAGLGEGAGGIDFGSLLPIARSVVSTAASFFGFLIIPIWAFYILRDRVRLTDQFAASLPPAWRDEVWAILTIVERVFGRWVRGQIILGLIVGAATFGGLLLLGSIIDPRFLQFAVFLAVIAGVLELLPIIGPIISMIPTLLVALTTRDPVIAVIAVVVLYIVVQQLENAVLVPKIQGDAVELHPSVVIFSLIIGGAIAGLLGAILSIPIAAAGIQVYRYLFHRLGDDEVPSTTTALPAEQDTEPQIVIDESAALTPQPPPERDTAASATDRSESDESQGQGA
jgi:predicted PurR-regulated permease PerM